MTTSDTRPRGVAILIYLLPAVADMALAQIFFINAVCLARAGASASVVANTVTVWSVLYLLACPVIGRFVTPRNAARLMIASMGGMMTVSLLLIVWRDVVGIYILTGAAAISAALFFPPFQVFMKAVDQADRKPITYSTGLYTFSWSMGFAAGPFIAGLLMQVGPGWKSAYAFAASAAAATGVGIYLLKHLAQADENPTRPPAARIDGSITRPLADYSKVPDMVWLGWLAGGTGVVLISVVRAVFPSRAVSALHLSDGTQGTLFFLLSFAQALTGLALCRSRYWMYRPWAVAAFGVAGMAGMLALGFGWTPFVLAAGAVLFGVYAWSFFFYLVFHALVHPERSSRYVAVNESVVGIGGIVGPVAGGLMADRVGFGSAFAASAGLVVAIVAIQWVVHRRHPVGGPIPVAGPSGLA